MFELKESDLPELMWHYGLGARWVVRNDDGTFTGQNTKPSSKCNPISIAAAIAQIKAQKKPRTRHDALLEKLKDVRELAMFFVVCRSTYGFKRYAAVHKLQSVGKYDNDAIWKDTAEEAIQDEIAYLESPAEEEK